MPSYERATKISKARKLKKGQRLFTSPRQPILMMLLEFRPMYGAWLAAEYACLTGEQTNSVYTTLHTLKARGLIAAIDFIHEDKPHAIWYALTPRGRELLSRFRTICIMGVSNEDHY